MNSLAFEDPSLDNLDATLSLNDPSDIDTALLNDIDGKNMSLTAGYIVYTTSSYCLALRIPKCTISIVYSQKKELAVQILDCCFLFMG